MGNAGLDEIIWADEWEGRSVTLHSSGTWNLTKLLNVSCHHYDVSDGFAESTGVFTCEAESENCFVKQGTEAIMKVWLQHDPKDLCSDWEEAMDSPLSMGKEETRWLGILHDRGFKHMPQWFESSYQTQTKDMPYPGGFVNYLVEQKLPGQNLLDFRSRYDQEERHAIRTAFKEALSDMYDCRIVQNDKAARNVLWDAESQKCYFVDFEDCREFSDRVKKMNVHKRDFRQYKVGEESDSKSSFEWSGSEDSVDAPTPLRPEELPKGLAPISFDD